MMKLSALVLCIVALVSTGTVSGNYDDYDYGDETYDYEYNTNPTGGHVTQRGGEIPLCCQKGNIWNYQTCASPQDNNWKPRLDGAASPVFKYQGFPSCKNGKQPVKIHQDEIIFLADDSINLPYYVQLLPVQSSLYCVAKVEDTTGVACDSARTRVFACLDETVTGIEWVSVGVAHFLIIITLLAYLCIQELRFVQGQYMICWLIALLCYNICLYPGSSISINISHVSCIALGSVKYFFFCGLTLWFNVICFDVWRTLKTREDVSGRRRFLLYSVYTWVVGAILTTVVLIHPYLTKGEDNRTKQLMNHFTESCSLKMEMNMILELVLIITMVMNLVFLSLATSHVCSYPKFGNNLPRSDAMLSLKQGWKLYAIMAAFTVINIPPKIISDDEIISMWMFILVESASIFAIFAYRKTVLKHLCSICCTSRCIQLPDSSQDQEKGQLTSV